MSWIENDLGSKAVAVLGGRRISFLDHLIPLCHLWGIPLVCTDEWVCACAQVFYPSTEIIFASEGDFQQILSNYQTFVGVEPCRLHPGALQFGNLIYKGRAETIVGFHGNPCKFRDEYWIERYANEDVVLIYGEWLVSYFKEKGAWERLKTVKTIGNLRKKFYESHRHFFDSAIKPYSFASKAKKTLLWVTTWSYPRWDDVYTAMLRKIPKNVQVMLKLHPFMFTLYPEEVLSLKESFMGDESVIFIDEIPLVYPFLAQADFYLGDYSSVVYDFLSFDRPLFLMNGYPCDWATHIDQPADVFSFLELPDTLSDLRRKAYNFVFSG